MRTQIVGAGGAGRAMTVAARPIDQADATRLVADHHLPLTAAVDYSGVVDLWPNRELTILEERRATAVFTRATDAQLRWHGVRRPIPPTCVMCDQADVGQVYDLCQRCAGMFEVPR